MAVTHKHTVTWAEHDGHCVVSQQVIRLDLEPFPPSRKRLNLGQPSTWCPFLTAKEGTATGWWKAQEKRRSFFPSLITHEAICSLRKTKSNDKSTRGQNYLDSCFSILRPPCSTSQRQKSIIAPSNANEPDKFGTIIRQDSCQEAGHSSVNTAMSDAGFG